MAVFSDLEKYIATADVLRQDGPPSASMALLDDTGEITAHVIGDGNEDINTIYQACSISKAITALAVAKLVDLSIISYDDKVVDILSSNQIEALGLRGRSIDIVTIGSLVSHRSGLSQHGFPGYAAQSETPTIEDIFNGRSPSQTPRIHFSSMPFAQLSYSGGGYLLLQVCLEHVLHVPFAQLMHDIVLAPLSMSRSRYAATLHASEQNYAKAHCTGEQIATTTSRGYHLFPEAAAAGLWTTPTDLLKAVSAIQYSLKHEDGFLSQQTAQHMLTAVSPNHQSYSMARGWASDDKTFGHRGDNGPGFNTYVFGTHGGAVNRPDGSRSTGRGDFSGAFAIMTNSILGFATIQKLVASIFYLNRWPLVSSLPATFGSLSDFVPYAETRATYLTHAWKAWKGEWQGGWSIIEQDGGPGLLSTNSRDAIHLRPAAAPVTIDTNQEEHVFVAEGYELAVRLSLQDGMRTIHVVQSEGVQCCRRECDLADLVGVHRRQSASTYVNPLD